MTALVNVMPESADQLIIRPLGPHDSLVELTALLHRAYKVLADMGLRYMATHQSAEVTRERIARGHCSVAWRRRRMVGSITYYAPSRCGGSPWLDRTDVAAFGQLAVDPEEQGRGLGTRLVQLAESRARTDTASELALDTAENAKHLVAWYRRLGFRFIEYVDWDVTNYRSVIMSKRLAGTQD